MTCRMSGPNHGSGVRPALCQASPQSCEPDRGRDALGGRPQLRRVRVAGVEDPLGQRVGGEQHPGLAGHRRQLGPEVGGDEVDERRLGRPALDPAHGDVVRGRRGRESIEVLTDRERRVVRRQHQPDDAPEALRGQLVDRIPR